MEIEIYVRTGSGDEPLGRWEFEVPPRAGDVFNQPNGPKFVVIKGAHLPGPGRMMHYQVLVERE